MLDIKKNSKQILAVMGCFAQVLALSQSRAAEFSDLPDEMIGEISLFLHSKDSMKLFSSNHHARSLAPQLLRSSKKVIDLSSWDSFQDGNLDFYLNDERNLDSLYYDWDPRSLKRKIINGIFSAFPFLYPQPPVAHSVVHGLFSKAYGFKILGRQIEPDFINKLPENIEYLEIESGILPHVNPMPESRLALLSRFKNLKTLVLPANDLTDIRSLSFFSRLERLKLKANSILNINGISDLTGLKSLDLRNTRVRDIRALSSLIHLESLNLSSTWISDLKPILGLTKLKSLDLSYTPVSDFKDIAALSHLETLNLRMTQISDLQFISKLTHLKSLDLSDTRGVDLRPLLSIEKLTSLNLAGTRVSDFHALSNLNSLTDLILPSNPPELDGIEPIFSLEKLRTLAFDRVNLRVSYEIRELIDLLKVRLPKCGVDGIRAW